VHGDAGFAVYSNLLWAERPQQVYDMGYSCDLIWRISLWLMEFTPDCRRSNRAFDIIRILQ
jgi:hypothetical protein